MHVVTKDIHRSKKPVSCATKVAMNTVNNIKNTFILNKAQ